jgi:hypothetical protein
MILGSLDELESHYFFYRCNSRNSLWTFFQITLVYYSKRAYCQHRFINRLKSNYPTQLFSWHSFPGRDSSGKPTAA